jgi:hypothetical protein
MPKVSSSKSDRTHPYSRRVPCACCHFTKYANRDQDSEGMTVGQYVKKIWPNCPCGEDCRSYETFLTTMHRVHDIPVNHYFCSGRNSQFEHLTMVEQRSQCWMANNRSTDDGMDKSWEDNAPVDDANLELINQLQSDQSILVGQIKLLQQEIQKRDYYIHQMTSIPSVPLNSQNSSTDFN